MPDRRVEDAPPDAAQAGPQSPPADGIDPTTGPLPLRVLIVDPVADDRARARRWVLDGSSRPCHVAEAECAAAAIDAVLHAAAAGVPDCMLLEYHLPDMTAPQLLSALAAADGALPCPVVVWSSDAHADSGRNALRAGAHDVVGKGWMSAPGLARAMANAAERWQIDQEQRQQRAALQRQAQHDAFFVTLDEAKRQLADPEALKLAAVRLLGRHLQASRVVYCQVDDGGSVTIEQGYVDGVPEIDGRYRLDDYGLHLQAELRAGRTVVSGDIQNDPAYSPGQKAAYAALQLASNLSVPMLSSGQVIAVLGVYQSRPRHWTAAEVELTELTAARTQTAVARALADHTVREREQQLRLALQAGGMGVWTLYPATDESHVDAALQALAGLDAPAAGGSWAAAFRDHIHPDDLARVQADAERAMADGQHYQHEFRYHHPDGRALWLAGYGMPVRDRHGRISHLTGVNFDITPRKQVEQDLLRSRSRLVELIEQMPSFTAVLRGPQHVFEMANQPYRALVGRGPEILGLPVLDALPEIADQPFPALLDQVLRSGQPFDAKAMPVKLRRQGAEVLEESFIDLSFLPLHEEDGSVSGILVHGIDRTEQVLAVQALDRSKHELQTLTDNTPDILTRFDRDFRHLFVNAAVERVTGRPRADFLGRSNAEMGMPDSLVSRWERELCAVFANGQPRSFEFAFDASALPKVFETRLTAEVDAAGSVTSVLGVTRDVTAARTAEQQLREGEERLRLTLAAAEAGAWDWDVVPGRIVWSPENFRLYGLEPADGVPQYRDWESCIHPDDLARANQDVQDALDGVVPEFRSEFRVLHPTRGVRWLLGQGRVAFDARGKPARMVGINLDITPRKQMEQALLEQDQRKDEFLATLAHELRNPLAPIRNGLALLQRHDLPQPAANIVAMMDRQLKQLVHLVDDLLDVSRVSLGKIELRRERLAVADVLDAAVEACWPSIEARQHALSIKLPAAPVQVLGDRTRLVQVVCNLLTNASKYSEPQSSIDIVVGSDGRMVDIQVSDTGVGIAAETLPTLWNMFSQVRDTLDKAQGGLGIGLSLARKLVELHGGNIHAASDGPGRGSTFSVRLPLAPPDPDASAQAQPSAADGAAGAGRRVLIVDDNEDNARTLALLLELDGHVVATAAGGLQALARAGTFLPEFVLLDIGLPGMDGYEVARRLRAGSAVQPVIVAMTGWGSDEDKRRSREAGFDDHLTKPLDPAVLKSLLSRPPHG